MIHPQYSIQRTTVPCAIASSSSYYALPFLSGASWTPDKHYSDDMNDPWSDEATYYQTSTELERELGDN